MNPTSPLLNRRQLLTALAVAPLLLNLPQSVAKSIDVRRVVALEWLPVELLLALGVTPFAVADTANYRVWVGEPALPGGVIDVGLRTEPNLELLTQLQPSLILYSAGYGPAPAKLARIAPEMGFNFNDGSGKPLTVARHSLVSLAQRLGLQQAAQQHLIQFDKFLARMKIQLAAHSDRPVLLMSFIDARHALVIGKNSLFQQVLDLLNLRNAWQGETNFWGSAVVGIERLATIQDADVLCFDHRNDAVTRRVLSSPLWKAMPFVRQQRFHLVPPVWFYGATLSAMHFTVLLADALKRQR